MRKNIIVIVILLVVGLTGAAIFGRSRVSLKVDPTSAILKFDVAVDGGEPQPMPATLRLRFGKHSLVFSAPDAEVWEQDVRAWPPFPRTLTIALGEPELPGLEKYLEAPYLGLFPYEGDDYKIVATTLSEGEKVTIAKLTIVVTHRFQGPQDGQAYIDERNAAADTAKKWLKEQGVPDTIPVEVTDQ